MDEIISEIPHSVILKEMKKLKVFDVLAVNKAWFLMFWFYKIFKVRFANLTSGRFQLESNFILT